MRFLLHAVAQLVAQSLKCVLPTKKVHYVSQTAEAIGPLSQSNAQCCCIKCGSDSVCCLAELGLTSHLLSTDACQSSSCPCKRSPPSRSRCSRLGLLLSVCEFSTSPPPAATLNDASAASTHTQPLQGSAQVTAMASVMDERDAYRTQKAVRFDTQQAMHHSSAVLCCCWSLHKPVAAAAEDDDGDSAANARMLLIAALCMH